MSPAKPRPLTPRGIPERRPIARSKPIWIALVVLAIALAYVGRMLERRRASVAGLPALPALTLRSQAIRDHLVEADRRARADPTSAQAVGSLGLAYHADLFYDEARRAYMVAERLDRSAWQWAYYRALADGARGDPAGLANGLRQVVEVAPDFSPAWWQLGEAEFKAGHHDQAEQAWRRADRLPEPTRPAPLSGWPSRVPGASVAAYARLGLARIAMAQGNVDRARELLETATATGHFGPGYRFLASVYTAQGRGDEAKRALRKADQSPAYDPNVDPMIAPLVQESRNATFLLQQAASADMTTNGAWRERVIRRALEVDADNTDALFELASVLRVLRRYDEALELLERHRRLVPGDFQVLADIGRCLSGLQRWPQAETVLRQAVEGLDDGNSHYDLGLVLNRLGRTEESMAEYRRALDRNPNHRDALNNLAVDLARQGRLAEATDQFQRLVRVDPDNVDAHTNFGAVLMAQGHRERAVQEFQAALQLNPHDPRAKQGLAKTQR